MREMSSIACLASAIIEMKIICKLPEMLHPRSYGHEAGDFIELILIHEYIPYCLTEMLTV